MKHYIGLDISMETISFYIFSEDIAIESGIVSAVVHALDDALSPYKTSSLIGWEKGGYI